jgi:hypothetical protein
MNTQVANRGLDEFPSTRAEALALELLIDVDEWCEAHGIPSIFPFPAAMTRDLLDAIESIPFAMIGKTTPAERSRRVFEYGAAALERCRLALEDPSVEQLETRFSAPLPRRAGDRVWSTLKVHCGRGDDTKPVVTIGLPDEEL